MPFPTMHVAFIASEAFPYAKTGGLADVVGALPRALARLGHEVTLLMPLYRPPVESGGRAARGTWITVPVGKRRVAGLACDLEYPEPGVRVLGIDQPEFYARSGPYVNERGEDHSDNLERFVFLCRAALEAIVQLDLRVDCLHAHDWQAGLAPLYLDKLRESDERFRRVGCVFTIHNIAYQGLFDLGRWPVTGLDKRLSTPTGLEFHGRFSCLKGGIAFSDVVTTVSENYAREIQGAEFGAGMDGVLRNRSDRLVGIVNGIDAESWRPATDAHLPAHFDATNWRIGKEDNRRHLRDELALPGGAVGPMLGFVGRLADQKGIDLLAALLPELAELPLQVVILGSGETKFHRLLERLARGRPDKLAVRLTFDESLARRIYAASDLFVMPSRFEPCGLGQLYALRYGSVPVVRAVGGLVDTVVDANDRTLADGTATGFHFRDYSSEAFLSALQRALRLHSREDAWGRVVERGMSRDWSWEKSARRYEGVYRQAIEMRKG